MYFSILGCWQLSDKISENNPPLTNPGENFSLCPSGILIHDGNHDLLCFQPLELDSKDSKTATSHGRILVSLMIHNLWVIIYFFSFHCPTKQIRKRMKMNIFCQLENAGVVWWEMKCIFTRNQFWMGLWLSIGYHLDRRKQEDFKENVRQPKMGWLEKKELDGKIKNLANHWKRRLSIFPFKKKL